MCVAVLATFVNVALRYLFNRPIYQAEEIATSMFVWLVFIGAGACYGERMHIGIDVLVGLFKPAIRSRIQTVIDAVMIALTGLMTYMSIVFTMQAGNKLTPALRIHYSWIDVAAVLGFGFMFIHSIGFLISDIKAIKAKDYKAVYAKPDGGEV